MALVAHADTTGGMVNSEDIDQAVFSTPSPPPPAPPPTSVAPGAPPPEPEKQNATGAA